MHAFTVFEDLKYNTRGYFSSCLAFFLARKERGLLGAMNKISSRIINKPSNMGFIIYLLPGIFFSNMRPRSDNPPHPTLLSLTFLSSIDTKKICFYCHIFFITCQPSTTAKSVKQNSFTLNFRLF